MFPTDAPATLSYSAAAPHFEYLAPESVPGSVPESGIDLRDVTAIWHLLAVGARLPAMEVGERETCVTASEHVLIGLFESLDAFQLDPQSNKLRADNKPSQLRLAQRLGLEIPETIITNDAEAVRAFARRAGPIITKMLIQPGPVGPSDGTSNVVFTTELGDDELATLGGLELCPMIFQSRVQSIRDVRVTIVGHRVLAAALEARTEGAPGDGLDWRRDGYVHDRAPIWQPYELPAGLAERVGAMLDHFGLSYGAADFLVRPDGRHVFLELNASGSFGFLGDTTSRAIASAIADTLIDPTARRSPR